METYMIKETWENFKQFEGTELNNIDFMDIGYLYSTDEILFRCTDDNILNKIKGKYEVTTIDQLPEEEVTNSSMWRYFGNSSLFRG